MKARVKGGLVYWKVCQTERQNMRKQVLVLLLSRGRNTIKQMILWRFSFFLYKMQKNILLTPQGCRRTMKEWEIGYQMAKAVWDQMMWAMMYWKYGLHLTSKMILSGRIVRSVLHGKCGWQNSWWHSCYWAMGKELG